MKMTESTSDLYEKRTTPEFDYIGSAVFCLLQDALGIEPHNCSEPSPELIEAFSRLNQREWLNTDRIVADLKERDQWPFDENGQPDGWEYTDGWLLKHYRSQLPEGVEVPGRTKPEETTAATNAAEEIIERSTRLRERVTGYVDMVRLLIGREKADALVAEVLDEMEPGDAAWIRKLLEGETTDSDDASGERPSIILPEDRDRLDAEIRAEAEAEGVEIETIEFPVTVKHNSTRADILEQMPVSLKAVVSAQQLDALADGLLVKLGIGLKAGQSLEGTGVAYVGKLKHDD